MESIDKERKIIETLIRLIIFGAILIISNMVTNRKHNNYDCIKN